MSRLKLPTATTVASLLCVVLVASLSYCHAGEDDDFDWAEGCNNTAYMIGAARLKRPDVWDFDAKDAVCFQVVDDLRRRQFGPPNDWELYQVTCKGPCIANYYEVYALEQETNCDCGKITRYNEYLDLIGDTTTVRATCLKTHTDHMCKKLQICHDSWQWHRHWCRGCGWEAANEDQWKEERDPDFGCGAGTTVVSLVILVVATVATAALQVLVQR